MPEQGEREGKGQTASVIYNVRPRILNVVRDIKALTLTSIGPEGSVKCLLAHPESGSPILSSISERIFNALPATDPFVRIFKDLVAQQSRQCGDGGLTAAYLASSLLYDYLSLSPHEMQLSAADYNQALMEIMTSVLDYLTDRPTTTTTTTTTPVRTRVDLASPRSILPLVRSLLTPHPVCAMTRTELDHLTVMLTRAFYQTLQGAGGEEHVGQRRTVTRPQIRWTECDNAPISSSQFVVGVVWSAKQNFEDQHWDGMNGDGERGRERESKRVIASNARVAVFNISLLPDDIVKQKSHFVVKGDEIDTVSLEQEARQVLQQLQQALIKAEVQVVLSQKLIDHSFRAQLRQHGITCIERVSALHIEQVEHAAGARVISTIGVDDDMDIRQSIGHISSLYLISISRRPFLVLQPVQQRNTPCNIATVIIAARHIHAVQELTVACKRTERALHTLLSNPYTLPGRGQWQMNVASRLQLLPSSSSSSEGIEGRGLMGRARHFVRTSLSRSLLALSSRIQHAASTTACGLSLHLYATARTTTTPTHPCSNDDDNDNDDDDDDDDILDTATSVVTALVSMAETVTTLTRTAIAVIDNR